MHARDSALSYCVSSVPSTAGSMSMSAAMRDSIICANRKRSRALPDSIRGAIDEESSPANARSSRASRSVIGESPSPSRGSRL